MTAALQATGLALAVTAALLAAVCLRRPLARLLRLGGKTLLGLGFLALFRNAGALVGLTLGVNLPNALTLALLGVPGLGLLMLLGWVTKL